MKVTASGGTDGANIVLFWPDNLPEDADHVLQDDPVDLVERLRDEGKLIWFLCDGDGAYTVSVFLQSAIPNQLFAFCEDEERYQQLVVKGEGYFGGMEYMFKNDRRFLDQYPHMCEKVVIPPGTYSAKVYRTVVPESFHESWLLENAGPAAKCVWVSQVWLVGLSVVGLLASVVCVFFLPWLLWSCLLGVTLILGGVGLLLSRTEKYKSFANARSEYAAAYPSYVVQIE